MSKRALRRHHRERMIAHARTITRRWHGSYEPEQMKCVPGTGYSLASQGIDHTLADSRAVKYHNNLKLCSKAHHGCGNRRHGGFEEPLTRQELLNEFDFQEQTGEITKLRLED